MITISEIVLFKVFDEPFSSGVQVHFDGSFSVNGQSKMKKNPSAGELQPEVGTKAKLYSKSNRFKGKTVTIKNINGEKVYTYYKDIKPKPIKLPPRQKKVGYVRPPIEDQNFVPEAH